MAAADADFVALSDAVNEIITLGEAFIVSAQGYITLEKGQDSDALQTAVDALPDLLTAADAAVEALEE